MSWVGNTIVTASFLPHPQNERLVVFPVGAGSSGALQVEILGASSGTGNFVGITSPLQGGAVLITGSVYVLNPSGGGGFSSGSVQISGTASVWIENLPATQSVYLEGPYPLPMSGTVQVAGTASVAVLSLPTPVEVTGTVAVEQPVGVTGSLEAVFFDPIPVTGTLEAYFINPILVSGSVSVDNFPVTQSVWVVNPGSGSYPSIQLVEISGVLPISGALPITGTITVASTLTGTVSVTGTVEVSNPVNISSSFADPVYVSGNMTVNAVVTFPKPVTSTNVEILYPTASIQILAQNTNRIYFTIFNETTGHLLVRFGPSASLTGWDTRVAPAGYYESPFPAWCGPVSVINRGSGSGFFYVGEQM